MGPSLTTFSQPSTPGLALTMSALSAPADTLDKSYCGIGYTGEDKGADWVQKVFAHPPVLSLREKVRSTTHLFGKKGLGLFSANSFFESMGTPSLE